AKRGEPLYSEQCASCHGPDLTGGEMAPALTGSDFNSDWNDLPIGQLFERIRTTMPQNSPGSLSRQQNADMLAFLLAKANDPAGTTELPTQTELLNQIRFNNSVCVGNSVVPAGSLALASKNASMSAFCWRLRLPGLFCGIVVRMRSNSCPIGRSFQSELKSLPVSAGAISPPVRSGPWQLAHCSE